MVTLDKVLPRDEQAGPAVGMHRELADEALLKKLIEDHHRWTGSLRARELLDNWADARGKFVKVFPHEYKRVLTERAAKAQAAAATNKAQISAATVPAK
jgi:glutamate synthase (NADPH/NADH) large chain